jgi:hypothetical protein
VFYAPRRAVFLRWENPQWLGATSLRRGSRYLRLGYSFGGDKNEKESMMKRERVIVRSIVMGLALIGLLAFAAAPVANAATINYDFTVTLDGDGNAIPDSGLQGWTVIYPTSGELWANYGWPPGDDGYLGAGWEDANTNLGRSPAFTLDGSGPLTFTLFGSASPLAAPDVAPSAVPQIARVNNGFMGVALRDVAADAYVLSERLPANNYDTWTTLAFTAAELALYANDGKQYTLDFIDYNKPGLFTNH